MGFRRTAVTCFLKTLLNILCKIDCSEYSSVLAKNKPMLIIFNHVNFLEVPILITHSYPLFVSGLVKSETWNNLIFSFLFNTYKAVPINRSGAFSESFKKVHRMIDKGYFMCVAPEGTRSKDGVLGKGKAGIIELAFEADIPILPVAHYGGENVWQNIKKLKRTSFCIKAGQPFKIKFNERPDKADREKIVTEVMGRIALLLPEEKRGIYAQQANLDCKYLEFI